MPFSPKRYDLKNASTKQVSKKQFASIVPEILVWVVSMWSMVLCPAWISSLIGIYLTSLVMLIFVTILMCVQIKVGQLSDSLIARLSKKDEYHKEKYE